MIDIEALCRKLKPILGSQADELWYRWLASDWQEKKDVEVTIQMIAEKVLKDGPLEERKILLPPPTEEQAKGDFILGNVIYKNSKLFPIYLKKEDFIKQIGIFSVTGGGKSNTGVLMALELLKGKPSVPFMIIDWKRQYRSMFSLNDFPNMEKVEIYTAGRDVIPFLWNPFRPPPGVDYKTWLSVIVECLEKSHLAGLGVGDFIFRIYEQLFSEVKGEDFYPNFYDGMRELEGIKVGGREFLWWQSTKRIFKSFIFGPSSKTFNARNPIKLEELLEKPVILELDQEMPKPLRIFFSEIILRFIHMYRLSQGETDTLRHCLFMEEVHNLTRKEKFKDNNIDSLENVFREIRSFGQGLVSITQHVSLVPSYITGNTHTLILLAQQHQDDIESARKALFLARDDEVYLNMLKTGWGIVKIMERINPCLVQFYYVPVEKGKITDEWLKVNKGGIFSAVSDDKSLQNRGYFPGDKNNDEKRKYPSPQERLLADVKLHPFSGVTERYERLGLDSKAGNKLKKDLIDGGFMIQKSTITGSGWLTLFDLMQKGRAVLGDLGYEADVGAKESVEHKFWKNKISKYYKSKGFGVLVEEYVNGKPDIIVLAGKKRIAVEIETGKSDALGNIEKNLKAGFDEILCVSTNKETEAKIKQQTQSGGAADPRVRIISVSNFQF